MPANPLNELYNVIVNRKANPVEKSYTCYLFNEGIDKILKKCGEECAETIIAAKNGDNEATKNEMCDLIYHLLVLMAEMNIPYDEIESIINERRLKIGNLKEFKVSDKDS